MIKNNSKVLITGCGGMLGEAVYHLFNEKTKVLATDINVNEDWLSYLDVRDKDAVGGTVKDYNPDVIIHLAALTDMEFCEKEVINAYKTNTESVQFLSREASSRNIPFVYISTAGIFDGEKDSYSEDELPNPLSIYGKSKYYGERVALGIPKSIVIRAGWMMGGGPKKDKKFVNKIIKQINSGSKELFVVSDKHGTPCYTYDLAKSIFYLINNERYGVYHGICEGGASRFEVAEYLLKILGLEKEIKLNKVDSGYYNKEYFASRPFSEKLINNNLKKLDSSLTRDWKVCMREYVERFDWIKNE
jgi:dTDP-4-dehydrorhamnose reductase